MGTNSSRSGHGSSFLLRKPSFSGRWYWRFPAPPLFGCGIAAFLSLLPCPKISWGRQALLCLIKRYWMSNEKSLWSNENIHYTGEMHQIAMAWRVLRHMERDSWKSRDRPQGFFPMSDWRSACDLTLRCRANSFQFDIQYGAVSKFYISRQKLHALHFVKFAWNIPEI